MVSEHGLFGVPIQVLLEQDQKRVPGVKVPLFFQAVSGAVKVKPDINHFLCVVSPDSSTLFIIKQRLSNETVKTN